MEMLLEMTQFLLLKRKISIGWGGVSIKNGEKFKKNEK